MRSAAGAERARDLEIFARHRAGAVGDIDDDGEDRGEDDGGDARRAGIAEPQREQRQHDDHRHGVEAVDVMADARARASGCAPSAGRSRCRTPARWRGLRRPPPRCAPVAVRKAGSTITRGIAIDHAWSAWRHRPARRRAPRFPTASRMTRPAISARHEGADQRPAKAAAARRGDGTEAMADSAMRSLSPAREMLLDHEAEPHQADADQADDQDRGEHAARCRNSARRP